MNFYAFIRLIIIALWYLKSSTKKRKVYKVNVFQTNKDRN